MIITRTPFRLSFFGGGSDYPIFFKEHGGAVLGATINKYCWLMVRKAASFGKPYKIVYSKMEEKDCIEDIEHPAVRAVLADWQPDRLELYHTSDLPARSGVGSSSAFVVGLVKALVEMDKVSWEERDFAIEAINIEQTILKETVGCQDQFLCAYGGFRLLEFPKTGHVVVGGNHIRLGQLITPVDALQRRLMLFYTGVQRISSDVASSYVNELGGKYLAVTKRLAEMAYEGAALLKAIAEGGDPDEFGIMLDDAWRLKQKLKGVTTPKIDKIHDKAYLAGAIGSKVLGAGGGGHMLFYVPIEKQPAVRKALGDLVEVPFQFEGDGCTVVYNGEEG